MALKIHIETIPHKKQRYNTVGDWWYGPDASLQVRVSELEDWRMEVAIAIHELVECYLCLHNNISQVQVDDFDLQFESRRGIVDTSEPGDEPLAPYRVQHCVATGIERIVIAFLGVSWKDYEDKINSL